MAIRTLILLRHGEAEHLSPVGDDHGRRLTAHGRLQIDHVENQFGLLPWAPSIIYCSDSRRTMETLERLPGVKASALTTVIDAQLYHGTTNHFFNCAFQIDNSHTAALFIGHNPAWSELTAELSGRPISLGTGDAAMFQADLESWSEAGVPGRWQLIHQIRHQARRH